MMLGRRFFASVPHSTALSKKPRSTRITDPYLLSKHIQSRIAKGNLHAAIHLAQHAPLSARSNVIWAHLIQAAAEQHHPNLAWSLFNDAKKRGLSPTPHTFTHLFLAFQKQQPTPSAASLDRTERVFRQLVQEKKANVFHLHAALHVFLTKKQSHDALVLYTHARDHGIIPDVVTFMDMIRYLASHGLKEEAWRVWLDAVDVFQSQQNVKRKALDWKVIRSLLLDLCFPSSSSSSSSSSSDVESTPSSVVDRKKWGKRGLSLLHHTLQDTSHTLTPLVIEAIQQDPRIVARSVRFCLEFHQQRSTRNHGKHSAFVSIGCAPQILLSLPPNLPMLTHTDSADHVQPQAIPLVWLDAYACALEALENALPQRDSVAEPLIIT